MCPEYCLLWKLFLRGLQNDVSLIPAVRWQPEAEILLGPARDGQWHLAQILLGVGRLRLSGFKISIRGCQAGRRGVPVTIESLDCCMQGDPVQKLCS